MSGNATITSFASAKPTVHTKDGRLEGFVSKAKDESAKPIFNFLNVPYGKPPTGTRRFMPPEKNESWEGLRDATINMKHPVQDGSVAERFDEFFPMKHFANSSYDDQDEDCLKLNVFSPSIDKTSKLPVMFWIVGGAFMRASACAYDGAALSGMNDVVVVSPNYRVNALGFLSLGKGTKCPGNNGLLDIVLALKWVREHIQDFGGDPENVTIFGESAGACLVELLLMSPLAKGLFHKAIALSGSCLSSTTFGDGRHMCQRFLNDLNIPIDDDTDGIIEKLQSLPLSKIIEAQRTYEGLFIFKPTVDGHAIPDDPKNILKEGNVSRVPFISGVCDCEGGGLLCMTEPENFFTGCSEEDITKVFETVVKLEYPGADSSTAAKMLIGAYSYVAKDDDKMKFSKIYGQVLADVAFVVPALISLSGRSAMQIPSYLYVMSKRLEYNHSTTNGPGVKNKPDYVTCDHGDTCHYVWGTPFVSGDLPRGAWFTKDEAQFSRVVMKYFTNFAKSGDPNKGVAIPTAWPRYELKERKNIVLDETVSVRENYGMRGLKLQMEDIPQMMKTLMTS